jgi:hypothetical protein
MVRLEDIPEYLHSSELYRSLQEGCDQFDVPEGHMKSDQIVHSEGEAKELLSTLRYWGVEGVVDPVVRYLMNECKDPDEGERLVAEFGREFPYLEAFSQMIQLITAEARLKVAVSVGSITAIEYLRKLLELDRDAPENRVAGKVRRMKLTRISDCTSGEDVFFFLAIGPKNCLLAIAASNNRLECLKYLIKICKPKRMDDIHYEDEKGQVWCRSVCSAAAAGGSIECLRFLRDQGFSWYESTCTAAAGAGKLECLKYLHESGCRWNTDTCIAAASAGHLDCLQYVYERGCKHTDVCTAAARAGSLACLQYAHEKGAKWNEITSRDAAKFGHRECLQYALDHGCPYDGASKAVDYSDIFSEVPQRLNQTAPDRALPRPSDGAPQPSNAPRRQGSWSSWLAGMFFMRSRAAEVYPVGEREDEEI